MWWWLEITISFNLVTNPHTEPQQVNIWTTCQDNMSDGCWDISSITTNTTLMVALKGALKSKVLFLNAWITCLDGWVSVRTRVSSQNMVTSVRIANIVPFQNGLTRWLYDFLWHECHSCRSLLQCPAVSHLFLPLFPLQMLCEILTRNRVYVASCQQEGELFVPGSRWWKHHCIVVPQCWSLSTSSISIPLSNAWHF